MSDNVTIDLSGHELDLSTRECLELKALGDMPGWDILARCIAGIEAGTREALEDVSTPLDDVRGLQGRLGVAKDLQKIVRDLMPQVLAAMREDEDNA